MAYDKFLIAPIGDGLREDVKPWLIPDAAFERLYNAYNFRGRIEKRIGAQPVVYGANTELTTRLRIKVGTTNAGGDLAGTVPLGAAPISIGAVGQMFSIGTELFTVVDDTPGGQDMLTTSATAVVHTFNVTTGAFAITVSLGTTDVYWYPSLPVMGFVQYERSEVNDENTYAWDTRFSYRLLVTGWTRIGASVAAPNPDVWTGTDSDFFWSENYRGLNDYSYLLFTTNYTVADGIRYYDGATWTLFQPQYASNANEIVLGCRLIVSFQNRLLFLNTFEQDAGATTRTITNRCRYSRIGSPIAANSWREDVNGEGSFIDAPTREAIVSCAKIKNRLIVFFERSTYELAYTGNQVYPFIWREINSELGSESTFSPITFDKAVIAVGESGINACTGNNVQRIDNKIPDKVFQFHNHSEGPKRVAGVRDFYNEMAYWAVPSGGQLGDFPDRILVYNYKNNTWALWNDSITAFGHHQLQINLTWAEMTDEWQFTDGPWDSGQYLDKFKFIIAGNQQGYTFVMDSGASYNSVSMQITDIQLVGGIPEFTCINHNLSNGDWIRIEGCDGPVQLNDNHYQVDFLPDEDTFALAERPGEHWTDLTFPYAGGGNIVLLSQVEILTKRFNFYTNKAVGTNISQVDFYVDRAGEYDPRTRVSTHGELTVDYLSGASWVSLRDTGIATGAILGTAILETGPYSEFESTQQRYWHPLYMQAFGESIQFKIFWDDEQMLDPMIPRRKFVVNGMIVYASPAEII